VLEIFKRIDRKELEILGFLRHSKPQDMIIQELLVPPPQVRPAVEYGSSGKK
jgi:DNA-directed RNA polymerase beta' subunit